MGGEVWTGRKGRAQGGEGGRRAHWCGRGACTLPSAPAAPPPWPQRCVLSCTFSDGFPSRPGSPGQPAPRPGPLPASPQSCLVCDPLGEWAFVPADVFAGTTIEPSALVQKLDPDKRGDASLGRGADARAILPKKEKLKLRRERWLQKIEAIKLAEQKRKAERRRRATAVVGDLQPLKDALPELLELEAGGRRPRPTGRVRVSSRPRPAELSRMSAAQRLQLLEEERARFQELLASPSYRASPLLAIGQQLAQRMQLDGGGRL